MAKKIKHVPTLPDRSREAHKGDVGRVLVVGGSLGEFGMVGAPALTANAALRGGCGLVQIVTPPAALPHVAVLAPCATTRALRAPDADLAQLAIDFGADVVAIGPGMGRTILADQMLGLLDGFSGGVVIDADGLNTLAEVGRWQARWPHNVVLTPHSGEMRRLLEAWGLDVDVSARGTCTVEYATATGTVVALKGARTVVSNGEKVYVNQTGNAGMATAGAGDVLTGVVAALMGQKMSAFEAAMLGVHVHGLAGDFAAEQLGRISLIATDLLDFLPDAFCDLQHEPEA